MGNETDRPRTGYGRNHSDKEVPSYPPEVLTPEQAAYEQRVRGAEEMSEKMRRQGEGLLMIEQERLRQAGMSMGQLVHAQVVSRELESA